MNTWTPIFISALALSGLTVAWRTWLRDHPSWMRFFNRWPWQLGKIFTCGTCFTFWLTLGFLFIFNPFMTEVPLRIAVPANVSDSLQFFIQWTALTWLALFGRFLYATIEEIVYFFVHAVREGHSHH